MRLTYTLLLALVATLCTSCVSYVTYGEVESSLREPAPDMGRVILYGVNSTPGGHPSVFLDGQKVLNPGQGGMHYVDMDNGEHSFRLRQWGKTVDEFDFFLEARQVQYIRIDSRKMIKGGSKALLMSEERGRAEARECLYMQDIPEGFERD